MPTLNIGNQSVQVDDSFLKLSPEAQNATVDEISHSLNGAATPSAASAPITANNLVRSAASGATFGLADKFAAAMDAATHSVLGRGSDAGTFGQRYTENIGGEQKQSKEFSEAHPFVSTGAELAGGAAALGPLAETGIGARLLGLTGTNLVTRATTAAGTGAAIGATNAALGGEDVGHGAVTGVIGGVAGPVAGRAVGKAFEGARGLVDKLPPLLSGEAIKDVAGTLYKSPEIANVRFKRQAVADLRVQIRRDLGKLNERLAPGTHGIVDTLGDPINGHTYTMEDIETTRQMLGKQAGHFASPQDQTAAIKAKQSIDRYLDDVPQSDLLSGNVKDMNAAIKAARANWATQAQSDLLSGKADAAELSAAAANSGANYENALRQRLKGILLSPAQRAKFPQPVLDEMEKIVRGGTTANLMRIAGNLMGGGGGLGAVISGGAGALAGLGPGAVAVPAMGAGLKAISNRMVSNRVAALDEMIREAAPANAGANAARNAYRAAQAARIERMRKVGALAGQAAAPALLAPPLPDLANQ